MLVLELSYVERQIPGPRGRAPSIGGPAPGASVSIGTGRLMPIDELQREVAAVALHAAARHGFALAGGNALIAHGIIDRSTEVLVMWSVKLPRREMSQAETGPNAGRRPRGRAPRE